MYDSVSSRSKLWEVQKKNYFSFFLHYYYRGGRKEQKINQFTPTSLPQKVQINRAGDWHKAPYCDRLHCWNTTGDGAPFEDARTPFMIGFCFRPVSHFFFPLLVDKVEISLQRLQRLQRLPYLPSCHIIATPFPTPHEVFVVAVLCSGHVLLRAAVELLEKSWLKMVRCVTWWVFHNSLQKPGKQLAYTHAHNTFRNMCTCEHVNKAPVILSGWGVCGAGRLKIVFL